LRVAVVLSEAQLNRRGLLKLMLRIPELRGRLQELSSRSESLSSLCGAFEDASMTLERLRAVRALPDEAAILEYEAVCREIEGEIRSICARA